MVVKVFPSVDNTDEHGLIAVGGDLEVETLILAYKSGIFPWPINGEMLTWFAPPQRGVLFFSKLHVSRSLKKTLNSRIYNVRKNCAFSEVIKACATSSYRTGTWISREMQLAYINLHNFGYANSYETYYQGELVGGIYGVEIGKMFAGESMFYRRTDASKIAFLVAIDDLKNRGFTWIDCQMLTPLLKSFGAELIDRADFQIMLQKAIL
jgi:leucyl/phenylalanyl-tRNA---protein transferase